MNTQEAYAYKWTYNQANNWGINSTVFKTQADLYARYLLPPSLTISNVIPKLLQEKPIWYLLKK